MLSKNELIQQFNTIEEPLSLVEMLDRLDFIDAVKQGLEQSDRSEVLSQEELENEVDSWFR
jgi:predicted transcriptional regulator